MLYRSAIVSELLKLTNFLLLLPKALEDIFERPLHGIGLGFLIGGDILHLHFKVRHAKQLCLLLLKLLLQVGYLCLEQAQLGVSLAFRSHFGALRLHNFEQIFGFVSELFSDI